MKNNSRIYSFLFWFFLTFLLAGCVNKNYKTPSTREGQMCVGQAISLKNSCLQQSQWHYKNCTYRCPFEKESENQIQYPSEQDLKNAEKDGVGDEYAYIWAGVLFIDIVSHIYDFFNGENCSPSNCTIEFNENNEICELRYDQAFSACGGIIE